MVNKKDINIKVLIFANMTIGITKIMQPIADILELNFRIYLIYFIFVDYPLKDEKLQRGYYL